MSIERLSQRLQKMGERLAGVGNHDFCPWANGYVYWLKQPIGWFVVGAFASLLIALFLSPHAWITFGSLVIVMMLGVVWPWAAVRGMRGEIAFDRRRCHEGELVHVRLTIRNAWPVPLWGLAVEKGFFTVGHDTDGFVCRPPDIECEKFGVDTAMNQHRVACLGGIQCLLDSVKGSRL